MPSSPKQLAAKVELFEMMPGVYILRLNDMKFQPSALKVAASLPAGALSIAVVTPIDTKVFNLAGTNPISEGEEETITHAPARPNLRTDGTDMPASSGSGDPMEDAMRLAAKAGTEGMGDAAEKGADDANADPESERKPNKVRRRPETQKADVTPNSPCGRCGGTGNVACVNANNEPDQATCPVCKGSGEIHRTGRRGR